MQQLMSMQPLSIVALYGGLNGLLLLFLAIMVVRARVLTGTNIGDGGKDAMVMAQRAHGNAAEYMPMTLLLLFVLANTAAPVWLLHAVGGTLTIGRVIHALGLYSTTGRSVGRFVGINLTWVALLLASGATIFYALG